MKKLTKHAGVYMVEAYREVARVVDVVGTLHAVGPRVSHCFVAVQSRQQQHRYEYRQQRPCQAYSSATSVHLGCKGTNK